MCSRDPLHRPFVRKTEKVDAQAKNRYRFPSEILRSVEWWSFTDVSGPRIGAIFKGQEVQEEKHNCESDFLDSLTLEDGTDTLSRNVCDGLPLDAA
jgi:hypothetical protein